MIRRLTILVMALILTAHVTYLDVQAGSVLQYALLKNFLVFFLGGRWLSGLIGAVANILLHDADPPDAAKESVPQKLKSEIPASAFSEESFPKHRKSAEVALESAQPPGQTENVKLPGVWRRRTEQTNEKTPALWRVRKERQTVIQAVAMRG